MIREHRPVQINPPRRRCIGREPSPVPSESCRPGWRLRWKQLNARVAKHHLGRVFWSRREREQRRTHCQPVGSSSGLVGTVPNNTRHVAAHHRRPSLLPGFDTRIDNCRIHLMPAAGRVVGVGASALAYRIAPNRPSESDAVCSQVVVVTCSDPVRPARVVLRRFRRRDSYRNIANAAVSRPSPD
jgi:hypothetical protein